MSAFQPKSSPHDLNAYCEELDAALDKGEISEEQWYEGRKKATAIAYLSRDNPRAQSGHGGDESRWRYTRVLMILEAIHKDGSFLDVGCANGYLIECLQEWTEGSGLNVEFFGVDISEELIEFAKKRRPDASDRFFVANAVSWAPDRRFDFVHAHEISYAPRHRERQFLEHLLEDYLNPGGRLIIGPWAVGRDSTDLEERLSSWGYEPTGWLLKSQGDDIGLTRRMIWFDKA
ncbi:MAG: class I SAM-dependent methyltransferase [Planctomycetota bacterium]|jgi:SAM-dependent methyltransferase|nr:class I SAM-dependent methyltransferase [Planctomycetota bacterium]MDP6502797.1 class I SAM-dependent methyltransferase [Planctomycetota bacterium]